MKRGPWERAFHESFSILNCGGSLPFDKKHPNWEMLSNTKRKTLE